MAFPAPASNDMNDVSPRGGGRLYESVARQLRESLARGEYAIGERLPSERDLALSFKVSRPTLREAIISLELDGLVDVRTNSGVYVTALTPKGGEPLASDIGPFELLEARRIFESEVCALAARLIEDSELVQLRSLIDVMNLQTDVLGAEAADRSFHMAIAQATRNSAMVKTVGMLWDERGRSLQYRALSDKARSAGVKPQIGEHEPILAALTARDPQAARQAMWKHLSQVIDALLEATEVQAIETARAEVDAQRQRLAIARR